MRLPAMPATASGTIPLRDAHVIGVVGIGNFGLLPYNPLSFTA